MTSIVSTMALTGINATRVDVQVQLTQGSFAMYMAGLPDNAVKESRERVRGAFHALGIRLPGKRIAVNLTPADIAKEGAHYDLPIAVALLMAMGIVPADATEQTLCMGELSLNGQINPVNGCLPAAIAGASEDLIKAIIPAANAPEAAWSGATSVFGAAHLQDVVNHLRGDTPIPPTQPQARPTADIQNQLDIADIKGQETAKRAAEIAAAGGHNLLLNGPPGSGKSMLAQRLPGLLPPLTSAEALEVSMIHSVAGDVPEGGLVTQRPFRAPHHSASAVALSGGGLKAHPGEMSLAHHGILFLDELPEFPRGVLETLRQPLETGNITISRANRHVTYPARFQLIAAMNPCPCGYLGDPAKQCRRAPGCADTYQNRLSGPLLDRIDLHVNVPPVRIQDLDLPRGKESSADMAQRVQAARTRQNQRGNLNANLQGKVLEEACQPAPEARQMLQTAADKMGLSARAYHRVLKVARTIADLQDEAIVSKPHVAEALAFRGR